MIRFRDLSLGAKIGLGFSVLAAVFALTVLGAQWQARQTGQVTERALSSRAPTLQNSLLLRSGVNRSLAAIRGGVLLGGEGFREERRRAWTEEIEVSVAELGGLSGSWDSADIAGLRRIEAALEQLQIHQQQMDDIAPTVENLPALKLMMQEAEPVVAAINSDIDALVDRSGQRMQADVTTTAGRAEALVWLLWIALALGISMSASLGVVIARSISVPLNELVAVANGVARGEVDLQVDHESEDEIGVLRDALGRIVASQRAMADVAAAIGEGDLSVEVAHRSEADTLAQAISSMKESLEALVNDVSRLADAGASGQLSVRADPGRHGGEFGRIISGVNRTLDAVVEPVQEASHVLEALSNCDLCARAEGQYEGDLASLMVHLNKTGESLHDAMSRVAVSANQITGAGAQIAGGAQAIAQGAAEQASAIEETSAALHQMAAMSRSNAGLAGEARDLARSTKGLADDGTNAMGAMMTSMSHIASAAAGAAEIIGDINQIAFQTNLLALNAAVEAARAGDAGRGFAVVAEEVRTLAQRSQEAATKTEELIQRSVRLASEGEISAEKVHGTFDEIVTSVTDVAGITEGIAQASQEQNRGVAQISDAVAQMDHVTQQAAASAEESSSAADELAAEAGDLSRLVGQFDLGQSQRRPVHSPLRAVPPIGSLTESPQVALARADF